MNQTIQTTVIETESIETKHGKPSRYDIIDLLRAVAILLVVIRHTQLRIPFNKTEFLSNLPEQIFSAIFVSGTEGVRIFFVVSGFIITMTTLRRYSDLRYINAKQFYLFRFARIVPCLIALLIILTALHFSGVKGYVISSKFSYFEALFSALTFHLNWLEGMNGYLPASWDVLWSLSVEEVFYLVFPIVCLASRRKSVLYFALIALIIIGPLNRFYLDGNRIWQTKAYLSCMDSIAIGCLFALISHNKSLSKHLTTVSSVVGISVIIVILLIKRDPSFDIFKHVYLFKTLLSLGVGLVLISAVRQQLQPLLGRLLTPVIIYGRCSYEIYLTHMFVVLSAVSLYKKYNIDINNSFIWLIGIILFSGLLGYVVSRFFSEPMNVIIRKKANSAKQVSS